MPPINLLPAEIIMAHRKKALRSRVFTFSVIAAIVFLFGIGSLWFLTENTYKQVDSLLQARQAVARETELYQPVQKLQEQVNKCRELLQAALGAEINWQRLFVLLSEHIPGNVRLTCVQVAFDGQRATMTLQGRAAEHPATAAWVTALQEAEEISGVQLQFSAEDKREAGDNSAGEPVRFEIVVSLAVEHLGAQQ